jgi:hypothetical protein
MPSAPLLPDILLKALLLLLLSSLLLAWLQLLPGLH